MRALCARLVRRVKETAHAIVRSSPRGVFPPLPARWQFGPGKPFPPIELALSGGARCLLSGKIDRLDSFTDAAGCASSGWSITRPARQNLTLPIFIMGSSCNFRFILPPLPQRIKARGARGLPVFITCP